jgi:hypothetical protein
VSLGHRGSSSLCQRIGATGDHLSTNSEQTLPRHDAGLAADCWPPWEGGRCALPPIRKRGCMLTRDFSSTCVFEKKCMLTCIYLKVDMYFF